MRKKDTLGTVSIHSLNEAFKCHECLHYRNKPHSTRDRVCSEEGVKPFGIAPKCFTPNVTLLAKNSDQFAQVATMFEAFTSAERRLLLGVLRSTRRMKRVKFGTKLYFKVGSDFISNYLSGYATTYTSAGELVLMGSPDMKTRGSTFVAYITDTEGLLTYPQWVAKRKELKEQNRIFDPANRIVKRASIKDDYEPPTIDSDLRFQETGKKKKRRRDTDTYDFQVS